MSDIKSGEQIFHEDATTARTLRNIRKTLKKSIKRDYGIEGEELSEKIETILEVHGISKERFDFVNQVETIINEKINDVSIDDNSNKNEKSVSGILGETTSPVEKLIGYDYLYRVLVSEYGKKEAKRLSGKMYDYSLALADSSNILKNYCWALNASSLVIEGRPFGTLKSAPPKRIQSYMSSLTETIHQLSNHLAGAIAISSFFFDTANLAMMQEKITLKKLKKSKKIRKHIENSYQHFVHSVNHLSRNGNESPFTNVSIFDRVKLRKMLQDFDWYYTPENYGLKGKYNIDYVIEYIMELQNIFIEFFDKGDPLQDGLQYRFPVTTLNFSKTKEGKIEDEKFLNYVVEKDIYRYNIFVSEGEKVASCCRLISDGEMLDLASSVNSFGGSSMSMGSHRVLTINFKRIALEAKGDTKKYFEILSERIDDSAKILKAHKILIEKLRVAGLQPFIDLGFLDMKKMFSTIGFIGLVEVPEDFKDYDGDIIEDSLKLLDDKARKISKESSEININIEQIPAESMSRRLPKIDKLLFGEDKVSYDLYSNQFVPMWQDATFREKMIKDGKYMSLVSGGGIVHYNVDSATDSKLSKEIIETATKLGSEHFSINVVYNKCVNNHTTVGTFDSCGICGGDIEEKYTRVVGFLTPVSSWSKEKEELDFKERHYKKDLTSVDE